MSEDEIASPFARRPKKSFQLSDEEMVSLAESHKTATPPVSSEGAHHTLSDPALANHTVVQGKGGMFDTAVLFDKKINEETEEADTPESEADRIKRETREYSAKQFSPAHLRIDHLVVEAHVTSFYQLDDYTLPTGWDERLPPQPEIRYVREREVVYTRDPNLRIITPSQIFGCVGLSMLAGGALAGGIVLGIMGYSGSKTDGTTTTDTTSDSTTQTPPGLDTRTTETSTTSTPLAPETEETTKEPATHTEQRPRPTNTPSTSLASFIGNYRFRTTSNGRERIYALDGTTVEKAQAYNLLTRIAFEDRLADPNATATLLEAKLFEQCDPDGNRRVTLNDVQRVAQAYTNLRIH